MKRANKAPHQRKAQKPRANPTSHRELGGRLTDTAESQPSGETVTIARERKRFEARCHFREVILARSGPVLSQKGCFHCGTRAGPAAGAAPPQERPRRTALRGRRPGPRQRFGSAGPAATQRGRPGPARRGRRPRHPGVCEPPPPPPAPRARGGGGGPRGAR